jgi:membrane-associated phospholipid phosphatase
MVDTFAQSSTMSDDSPGEIQFEKTLEHTGDILQIALPATALTATLLLGDKEGSKQFLYSFATNIILVHSLKEITHKKRPESSTSYNAFPSGHTAAAFHGAAFIQRRYGWEYGVPAYVLAGVVGYSRIEGLNDRHDGWDVLGGIVVGVGTAYLFTKPYKSTKHDISFSTRGDASVVSWKYTF